MPVMLDGSCRTDGAILNCAVRAAGEPESHPVAFQMTPEKFLQNPLRFLG
jgi:hypothetical protein